MFEYKSGEEKGEEGEKKKGIFGIINNIFSKKEGEEPEENKQELAKEVLKGVAEDNAFSVGGGRRICSLRELGNFLRTLDGENFKKYVDVGNKKNDFALWVSNLVGDGILGEKLMKQKEAGEMANLIESRVRELEPYLGEKAKVPESGEEKEVPEAEGSKEGDKLKESGEEEEVPEAGVEEKKDIVEKPGEEGEERDKLSREVEESEKSGEERKEGAEKVEEGEEKGEKSDSEKSVSELLEKEGVVATEEQSDEDSGEKEEPANLNDLFIAIEKIEGKLELFEQFRKSGDSRIEDVSERIGELRQMSLDKERSFNEVQTGFEKIGEAVSDLNPEEINKKLEMAQMELEKRDSRIETLQAKMELFTKEISEYRKTMAQIKDFESMINMLNKLKEEVGKIEEDKRYTKRMSAKSEHIFAELNEKFSDFKGSLAKIESTDEITKDLLKSVDELEGKQSKFVSEDDLDKFKGEMQKKEFGATKDDFVKTIGEVEKEILGLKSKMDMIEFKTKSVGDLMEEKVRIEKFVEKINADYQNKKISGKAHLESTGKLRRRLGEIDDSLKRLDGELLYGELNRITKLVNDNVVKIDKLAPMSECDRLNEDVGDLKRRIDSSNFENAIENLEDAKTNIFNRVGQTEREVSELDLKWKQAQSSLEKLQKLKNSDSSFDEIVKLLMVWEKEFDKLKDKVEGKGLQNGVRRSRKSRVVSLKPHRFKVSKSKQKILSSLKKVHKHGR